MTDLREALRALVEELKRRRDGWTASHLEVRRAYGSCADSIGLLLDEHPARASDVPAHQGSRNEMTEEEIDTHVKTLVASSDEEYELRIKTTLLLVGDALKALNNIAFWIEDLARSQRSVSNRD